MSGGRPSAGVRAALLCASLALLAGPVLIANAPRAGPAGVAAGAALVLAGALLVRRGFRADPGGSGGG